MDIPDPFFRLVIQVESPEAIQEFLDVIDSGIAAGGITGTFEWSAENVQPFAMAPKEDDNNG